MDCDPRPDGAGAMVEPPQEEPGNKDRDQDAQIQMEGAEDCGADGDGPPVAQAVSYAG